MRKVGRERGHVRRELPLPMEKPLDQGRKALLLECLSAPLVLSVSILVYRFVLPLLCPKHFQ